MLRATISSIEATIFRRRRYGRKRRVSGEALAQALSSRACRPRSRCRSSRWRRCSTRPPSARRQRAAVVFYGRSITYRELREATDRFACALADLGVKKGDRVALYLLNSPQFIIAYFARAQVRRDRDADQPGLHQPRGALPARRTAARAPSSARTSSTTRSPSRASRSISSVVTNVGEYLPALKRLFGKKAGDAAGRRTSTGCRTC